MGFNVRVHHTDLVYNVWSYNVESVDYLTRSPLIKTKNQ
jgi:hypothetical protein